MLPPTFAFGILNLPMLGWLAAAAAPVLIHLLSRRKYRQTTWAAMEYLIAALKRQNRRMQFEQLLLLIIRTLLVVLIVLAVAEPYIQRIGFAKSTTGRTHRVLVIDGSFSMAYKPTDTSRFDRAKQLAEKIVEESRQGDAFTLLLSCAPPEVVVGTPSLRQSEIVEEIDRLQRTDATADLPATVAKVLQIVQNARREHPGIGNHEVYFLTDLQRVGWQPELSSTAISEFKSQSEALAKAATVVVIDLGQPDAENLAVTALRTLEPVATPAADVQLEATLKLFARGPREKQAVELLVDGRRVARRQVDLDPGADAVVGFSYRFETPGDHAIEVRAEGDSLSVDNRRFLSVPVRQSLRVLCIDGRPSGEPFGGASNYLVFALSPQGDRAARSLVEADLATESALSERDLGRYDCVFLCDVAQFTAGEARLLDAYLQSGGNLVFFLGDTVLPERYNRELCGGSAGPRLLPARLGKVVSPAMVFIDPMEYRHPIVRAFRGREKAGLSTTPIFKYFQLTVPEDSAAKVAVQTTAGDPLIVEEKTRRGRVVLVSTSADTRWTPAPLWPSFVPLVQEILAFCAGGESKQRNVAVGEPLVASVSAPAADAEVTMRGPDGRGRAVTLQPDGDYAMLSYADTANSGIYTARFGSPADRSESFAVNVDTAESDLRQLTLDELRSDVWSGVPFLHQTTWRNLQHQATSGAIARTGRLPVDLLYVALALLLLETYLAWRFGYHTT